MTYLYSKPFPEDKYILNNSKRSVKLLFTCLSPFDRSIDTWMCVIECSSLIKNSYHKSVIVCSKQRKTIKLTVDKKK